MATQGDDVKIADNPYMSLDDHGLLMTWDFFTQGIKDKKASLLKVEAEIKRRLDDREGSMIDDPDYTCELKEGRPTWDESGLWRLKELVEPDTLKENGWTPAYEEVVTNKVPESWNMTNLKKLVRLGKAVAQVIEAARIPGALRMVIKRKETKS